MPCGCIKLVSQDDLSILGKPNEILPTLESKSNASGLRSKSHPSGAIPRKGTKVKKKSSREIMKPLFEVSFKN